ASAYRVDNGKPHVLPSTRVGAYRDDNGKPYVLPSIREAEKRLFEKGANKEYAGITGIKEFNDASIKFAYGADSAPLKEGRIAAAQTSESGL
ncbi:hypothetical protein T484DRAFT_1855276, partial [Baffinella frigidus]